MAAPKVTSISKNKFQCKVYRPFNITGTGFTPNVHVTLHETKKGKNHDWIQQMQTWASSSGGTLITITAKPQKNDGTDCVDREIGDLTVTVINLPDGTTAGPASQPLSTSVTYTYSAPKP
jgi:hypothetical protein